MIDLFLSTFMKSIISLISDRLGSKFSPQPASLSRTHFCPSLCNSVFSRRLESQDLDFHSPIRVSFCRHLIRLAKVIVSQIRCVKLHGKVDVFSMGPFSQARQHSLSETIRGPSVFHSSAVVFRQSLEFGLRVPEMNRHGLCEISFSEVVRYEY